MKQSLRLLFVMLLLCLGRSGSLWGQSPKQPLAPLLYQLVVDEGIDQAVNRYLSLKQNHQDDYDFSFSQLDNVGKKLLQEEKTEAALRIFELNLDAYPDMARPYYSYGEALYQQGEKDRAVDQYERGLEVLARQDAITDQVKTLYRAMGEQQIRMIQKLNQTDAPDLTYVADFGGVPAGLWDADMVLSYQESHPHLSINYHSNNFYNAHVPFFIHERFESGRWPDVASSTVKGVYRDYVKKGVLADVAELWAEHGWDDAFPASIKTAVSYDGTPYFVPITFQWNPIWYRKDIFEELGLVPPQTWEELLLLCDKLHAAGYVPFTLSGKGWKPPVARWFVILTLRLHGPDFYETLMQGRIPWTDDRIKEVFQHWQTLFEHHAFDTSMVNHTWATAENDLSTGRVAMWNIGEWVWESSVISSQADKLDFFPMPPINPTVPQTEIVHLYGAHWFADTPNRDQAEALLTHLASETLQRDNHATLNYRTPAHQGAYDQLSALQKRQYDYIKKVDHLVPLFEINTHPKMADAALNQFLEFWANPAPIDPILHQLEQVRRAVFRP